MHALPDEGRHSGPASGALQARPGKAPRLRGWDLAQGEVSLGAALSQPHWSGSGVRVVTLQDEKKGVGGQLLSEEGPPRTRATLQQAAPPLNPKAAATGLGRGRKRPGHGYQPCPQQTSCGQGHWVPCEAGGFPSWGPLASQGATPGPQCPGPRAASSISLLLTKPENTELAAHLVPG